MITTTDLDLVAYCIVMLKKDYEISEETINNKIAFDVDITEEERQAYYKSDFRKIKRNIDDLKRVISDIKKDI